MGEFFSGEMAEARQNQIDWKKQLEQDSSMFARYSEKMSARDAHDMIKQEIRTRHELADSV